LVESTTFAKNLTFAKILVPCHAILHAVENLHATGQLEASIQIILVPYRTACHRKVHAVLYMLPNLGCSWPIRGRRSD
jgi:hypothetical protein